MLRLWAFWVPYRRLYCSSFFFSYGSYVELASADKPAGDALPGIDALPGMSVDGLIDHTLTYRLSRVGYMVPNILYASVG